MTWLCCLLLSLLLLQQFAFISADNYGYCGTSVNNKINTDTVEIGCNGYTYSTSIQWSFSNNETLLFNFASFSVDPYASINIQDAFGTTTISSTSPPQVGANYIYQGPITVSFYSQNSYPYGFAINIKPAPSCYNLISGQTVHTQQQQSGGFVYFLLSQQSFGQNLNLNLRVYTYQGLQSPAIFVSNNMLPSLEFSQFSNQTVPYGSDQIAQLSIPNPKNGNWYVGVFLYGSAADISIDSQWSYDASTVVPLVSGVSVTATVSTVLYYQAVVPVNTSTLFFQVSRQVPGGYVIVYINPGTVPSATSNAWELDTRINSYMTLNIPNPNPINFGGANPGVYIVAVSSVGGNAGFILEATWSHSSDHQEELDFEKIQKLV